jgi:hypothetical protein
VGVEGTQNSTFCTGSGLWVIDTVDEERETNDIGEQDELLAYIAADLANLCQELDSCHPLVCAETGLASKVMDVRDESLEQVLYSRIFAL